MQEDCLFEELFCQNQGCPEKYPRKEQSQHEKKCPYKLITCEHCEVKVIKNEK